MNERQDWCAVVLHSHRISTSHVVRFLKEFVRSFKGDVVALFRDRKSAGVYYCHQHWNPNTTMVEYPFSFGFSESQDFLVMDDEDMPHQRNDEACKWKVESNKRQWVLVIR